MKRSPVPLGSVDNEDQHRAFLSSTRKHILMITNHGIHQWRIIPGLPDTGGQNVFVNQFTATLAELGFRITIANRGGYPHPVTGRPRQGLHYRDDHQRILYMEDGVDQFVRKEDIDDRIPSLVAFLSRFLEAEHTDVDLIISHYWDGAKIGVLYDRRREDRLLHAWVPHSLGAIKKRNVPREQWERLRIDERIAVEELLIPEVDAIAATSLAIRRALREDYAYSRDPLFLPPCVDTERYHPRAISDTHPIWEFIGERSGLAPDDVRNCRIVTEISRTDTTKRKDLLLKAFAQARQQVPDSLLVVSIDDSEEELARDLKQLIESLDLRKSVAAVGYVWDQLPFIYSVTDVYCTPSVMEGFGMSAQEAAATGVAVVASDRVPFVTEYLLGESPTEVVVEGCDRSLRMGDGAVVVSADDMKGFASALEMLLADDGLRQALSECAYEKTVPYFTWRSRVPSFLKELNVDWGSRAV
ncbi:MAG: glycosyltransferase [Anaerolineae bacterium]